MIRRRFIIGVAFCLISIAFAPLIEGRTWHTASGQTFEGDFVRAEGDTVVFRIRGKESAQPLSSLSVADRLFVGRLAYQQRSATSSPSTSPSVPAAAATPAAEETSAGTATQGLMFGPHALRAGKANEVDVQITDATALQTVQKAYGKPSTTAKMLLALPADFEPAQKVYPILIVSATTDGKASSISSARYSFLPDATNKGYVLMAIDGEFGKPENNDSLDFRWALVSSGLDGLAKQWPNSKSWPIATGGVSGGGGYASHQAMMLLQKRARVTGLFLAVSPWSPTHFANVVQKTPFAPLHNLPIFMSAGDTDTRVTKDKSAAEHASLVREGFRNIRFEHFPGGHEIHRPHLQAALDWFVEQDKKSGPAH